MIRKYGLRPKFIVSDSVLEFGFMKDRLVFCLPVRHTSKHITKQTYGVIIQKSKQTHRVIRQTSKQTQSNQANIQVDVQSLKQKGERVNKIL